MMLGWMPESLRAFIPARMTLREFVNKIWHVERRNRDKQAMYGLCTLHYSHYSNGIQVISVYINDAL